MKPQELMTLALRVLAVFLAAQALIYLADAIVFYVAPSQIVSGLPLSSSAAAALIGPAIAAILVWSFAPQLARIAARGMVDEPISKISSHSVVSATFATVGALILILALPSLLINAVRSFGPPGPPVLPAMLGAVLQCLLGVVLVLGSGAMSRPLLRLRYAGATDL